MSKDQRKVAPEHSPQEPAGGSAGTTESLAGGDAQLHLPKESRSTVLVFVVFWAISFAMTLAPGAAWHGWRGVLLAVAGITMILLPPRMQILRLATVLAASFLILAAMVFLPAKWFPLPAWREQLSASGLLLSPLVTAQPLQTIECLAGCAICVIVLLFLTGHHVNHGGNHLLGLLFTLGVALVALFAMAAQDFRWTVPWDSDPSFGFFANRNHMATLLVMGTLSGAGVIVQSVRVNTWGSGIVALASVIVCLRALIGYSDSRAGIVLFTCMFTLWIVVMGRNYLRGRALAAAGLLAGGIILYYTSDQHAVKMRIDDTVERLALVIAPNDKDVPARAEDPGSGESFEGRVPIYLDTFDMIRAAPWTGIGIGQFQYVFPQFRHRSAALNHSQSVHPESDWLLMASEAGIPATIALGGLVALIGWSALRFALRGRARALRTGCLAAAAIVPLHGFLDVPGHRMELVWAACLLVAITRRSTKETRASTPMTRTLFRVLGCGLVAAGAFLVQAQWFGGRQPARLLTDQTLKEVVALYSEEMADFKSAEEGATILNPTEDRLEKALGLLDNALQTAPLDHHLHYLKGAISLYFDDKNDEIDRAFMLQRLLDPSWVAMPLMQAAAWSQWDPERTGFLWTEALIRAASLEKIDPKTPYGRADTFANIMRVVLASEDLTKPAIGALNNDQAILESWASRASSGVLDSAMPDILTLELPEDQSRVLFQIWHSRGTPQKAEAYAKQFRPGLIQPLK